MKTIWDGLISQLFSTWGDCQKYARKYLYHNTLYYISQIVKLYEGGCHAALVWVDSNSKDTSSGVLQYDGAPYRDLIQKDKAILIDFLQDCITNASGTCSLWFYTYHLFLSSVRYLISISNLYIGMPMLMLMVIILGYWCVFQKLLDY